MKRESDKRKFIKDNKESLFGTLELEHRVYKLCRTYEKMIFKLLLKYDVPFQCSNKINENFSG